jgi:hypothetical protein
VTDDRLRTLHDHLAATAERPVERGPSRWLGEAEAVAADLVDSDLSQSVRRERVETIEHILSNVDGTGDPVADDHVAMARSVVEELLADR